MAPKNILHMLTPLKHMSPFDVNMAADAGYKVIVPYINVTLEETTALVQDAIFSRPPNYGVRTGFFIGGKDAILAGLLDLVQKGTAPAAPDVYNAAYADVSTNFIVPKMVQRVVIDNWDADKAIDEAQTQIQAIYDKYK